MPTSLRNLLRAVFRHDSLNSEMNDEMRAHLERSTERLMERGMSRRDAEAAARREFGNVAVLTEEGRDARGASWVETLRADVRYAARSLRKSPAFAIVAILSLAIGVGANTAIFGLINAVMLRPLPVPSADEIVLVGGRGDGAEFRSMDFTNVLYESLRDRLPRDVGLAATGPEEFNLSSGGEEQMVAGEFVSGTYFKVLGVSPEQGRLLTAADDFRGCPPVAVVSHAFWRSHLGGRSDAVGSSLSLRGTPYTVIGVTRESYNGFFVGYPTSVFVPICRGGSLDARSYWWLTAIARRGHYSLDSLNGVLRSTSRAALTAAAPERYSGQRLDEFVSQQFAAAPSAGGYSTPRQEYGKALMALMAMVAVVLLISCANVANLMLARGAARAREIAIRAAIGASRARLMRQMIVECTLLAGAGAAMGILLAMWTNRSLVALIESSLDVSLDWRVLLFTGLAATTTVMLCGLLPAWRASLVDPQSVLKHHNAGRGSSRFRIGRGLVVAQFALALTVVTVAGLLVSTLTRLTRATAGFDPSNVLIATVDFKRERGGLGENLELQRAVLDGIRAIPGVQEASISNLTPIGGGAWNNPISTDFMPTQPAGGKGAQPIPWFNSVGPGYFRTLRTRLTAGRDFDAGDTKTAPRVAIVNAAAARRFFGSESALGKTFRMNEQGSLSDPILVVGMVENSKYRSLRAADEAIIYLAAAQDRDSWAKPSFVIRSDLAPKALSEAVAVVATRVDSRFSLRFTTLEEKIMRATTRERVLATLSAVFGTIAFLLSVIGLYGVMAYTVARRRVEIGVRIALGAGRVRVVSMVLGDIVRLMLIGLTLGTLGVFLVTPMLKQFLFGVEPYDAMTVVGATSILALGALLAGAIPARRAAALQPVEALRED